MKGSAFFFERSEQKNNRPASIDKICQSNHVTLHNSDQEANSIHSHQNDIDDDIDNDINDSSDHDQLPLFPNINSNDSDNHNLNANEIKPHKKRTKKKMDEEEDWIPPQNQENDIDSDQFNFIPIPKKKKKTKKSNNTKTKKKKKLKKSGTKRKRSIIFKYENLFQPTKKRRTNSLNDGKRPQYNDEINTEKHRHLTIIRKAPTLQTIAAEILGNDKKVFDHYHKYLRDDIGSNWQDSIEVGDVLQFNYSSTYKMRLTTAMTKKINKNTHKNKKKSKNLVTYDMPKWIPIQITCKAYSATIEYIGKATKYKKDEAKTATNHNTKPLQETIRIGVTRNTSKSARIRPINDGKNSEYYLKEGHIIEIFDCKALQWIPCKIITILTYLEFEYKSYRKETISDSCYMDEANIRLPAACIPYNKITEHDIGRSVRVYWSHIGGGEWYEGTIQSVDIGNKILVLFYRDKYMEELRWNICTTLFYFPIKHLNDITSWIYLRPNCGYCGCLMEERMATKCKYQNVVCWKCDNIFVEKDSIWICPFEKRVKFHPRKYFIGSNCVHQAAQKRFANDVDGINCNQFKLRNTNLIVGHRNDVTKMAELYRIPIGAPLPHLQLIDVNVNENKPIIVNKETLETNKYLQGFIHKLYHSVLYQPYDEQEYFLLCQRYLQCNFIPLARNRKSPLNDTDIITAAKYSFCTKLQKVINIFLQNKNRNSLFYILKAIELRYFYIANAWNGRPKSKGLTDDLAMQYQWNINMKHNLIPSVLNDKNDEIINEIAENNNICTKQPKFIHYTDNIVLSGSISVVHNNPNNININEDDVHSIASSNDSTNLYSNEIKSARMGAFCVPQFDICIFVRDSSLRKTKKNKNINTKDSSPASYQLYKTAEAIVITRESLHISEREHEWRNNREISRYNPWIRGDVCKIYVDQSAIWLQAKIVKIYETECKVDIYSNELRYPKHRSYGGLSQYIMPQIKSAVTSTDLNDIALIDRLNHGTPIKLWGPPWRQGRVLWKWNENDLVCIQLNQQRLQYAQTYHVNDPKWKIEIIADKAHDIVDIQPPLQFIMAKSKYLAIPNHIINAGILILSEGESEYELEEDAKEENQNNAEDGGEMVEILDLANADSTKHKRQTLNKIKIIKLEKSKLKRVCAKRRKKRKVKKKKKQGIEVRGVEEGSIFYTNDRIGLKWKLNRCVIYDEEEENDNILTEKAFNIYLECKNFQCNMHGKVELEIDKILLAAQVPLIANSDLEYEWNGELPISFLNYEENDEDNNGTKLEQAICYIRVVYISNNYYCYRLNGTSNVFELRNEETQIIDIRQNKNENEEKESDIEGKEIEFEDDTELNANEQIHKNDNGAFCICGAIQDNIEEPVDGPIDFGKDESNMDGVHNIRDVNEKNETKKVIEWIQCDFCYCWQHIECLNIDKNKVDNNTRYKCVWCTDNDDGQQLQYFNNSKSVKMLTFIKYLFAASKYRGKRYGFWYGKKEKFDEDEKYENVKYLQNLCIARGVDSNSSDINVLQSNLTYCSRFARTPLVLSNFMCSLFGINCNQSISTKNDNNDDDEIENENDESLNCVDLMAGNGNITQFIAKYHKILAVERKETRLESGKHLVSNANWVKMDVFSKEFIVQYVIDKSYDIVYCNPDLNNIIPAIYIGLEMIKNSQYRKKCLIYLLPVDVFESNSYQCRLFRILNCHIDRMYQVGRWNYYDRETSHPKSICDGVWIIKPGKKSFKYSFRCYDVRTNLKLSSKSLKTD